MEQNKSPNALRTIGEVADDLGVATHVLRFWESKFNQIKPQKRRGRRYYRPEDIRVITQIKSLLYGQGYTIRGVQKFFAEGKHKIPEPANTEAPPTQPHAPIKDDRLRDLFGNIIEDDENTACEETFSDDEQKTGLTDHQAKELKEIHSGLLNNLDKLKSI